MDLTVNEIFYSIQGESTYSGRPCVFVRLTGCNLRCSYCDTQYAYNEGQLIQIKEICQKVAAYNCPLVEITGGEPLLQEETPTLVYNLLEDGHEVLVETNGTLDISVVDERCIRIMDIKCPSSGEHHQNDFVNLEKLTVGDEIKFVIACKEDYEFAKETLDSIRSVPERLNPVHFSPVFGKQDVKVLAEWVLEDRLDARLHLQMHKIIWDAETRGV